MDVLNNYYGTLRLQGKILKIFRILIMRQIVTGIQEYRMTDAEYCSIRVAVNFRNKSIYLITIIERSIKLPKRFLNLSI